MANTYVSNRYSPIKRKAVSCLGMGARYGAMMPISPVYLATSEPFRRRHPDTLCKDSRESCGICIPHCGRDQFQRVAFAQHCLGNSQPPICQVIKRCHTDYPAKMSSEARTGHT